MAGGPATTKLVQASPGSPAQEWGSPSFCLGHQGGCWGGWGQAVGPVLALGTLVVTPTQLLARPQMVSGTLGRMLRWLRTATGLVLNSVFPSLPWRLLFGGSPRWFPLTHLSASKSGAFHRPGAAGGTEQGLRMLGGASLRPAKAPRATCLCSALHPNEGQSQESLSPGRLWWRCRWHAARPCRRCQEPQLGRQRPAAPRPWVKDQGESHFKAKGYGWEGNNHKANTSGALQPHASLAQ